MNLAGPMPNNRADLFGHIVTAYADLGWAVPTSLEYAAIDVLKATLTDARHALRRRYCR